MTDPVQMKVPVSQLVEDFGLYPRTRVDANNVRDLANAIRAGEILPPIVVEAESLRIVDGFHRRRAWQQVKGPGWHVDVIAKTYEDEAEAFADCVRYNVVHGIKLNSAEQINAANRLRKLGWSDDDMVTVLRIPAPRVEKIRVRVAVREGDLEPVPLKGGDRHLQGRTLTPEQVEKLTHRTGRPYGRLARELLDGIEGELLPDDPEFLALLAELGAAIRRYTA